MKPLAYLWASPATLLGLVCALPALHRGGFAVVDGVIEAHGPLVGNALRYLTPLDGGAAAMTFGHVVLARDVIALNSTRTHERVHVRQYERWGPFFIPAYLLASVWAKLRGRHAYFDNPFEREAYQAE